MQKGTLASTAIDRPLVLCDPGGASPPLLRDGSSSVRDPLDSTATNTTRRCDPKQHPSRIATEIPEGISTPSTTRRQNLRAISSTPRDESVTYPLSNAQECQPVNANVVGHETARAQFGGTQNELLTTAGDSPAILGSRRLQRSGREETG